MITPDAINRYNSVARSVFSHSEWIHTWTSMPSLCEEDLDAMTDGLHLPLRGIKQATMVSTYSTVQCSTCTLLLIKVST